MRSVVESRFGIHLAYTSIHSDISGYSFRRRLSVCVVNVALFITPFSFPTYPLWILIAPGRNYSTLNMHVYLTLCYCLPHAGLRYDYFLERYNIWSRVFMVRFASRDLSILGVQNCGNEINFTDGHLSLLKEFVLFSTLAHHLQYFNLKLVIIC